MIRIISHDLSNSCSVARHGRQTWLVGREGQQIFAVRIRAKKIKTLDEALAWLRPEDVPHYALRQGDLYFVPLPGWSPPLLTTNLTRPDFSDAIEFNQPPPRTWRRTCCQEFSRLPAHSHRLEQPGRVVWDEGETAFVGRKGVRSHPWRGRPRYFVRGRITHPEHGMLDVGYIWHEVVPNRAVGPWRVDQRWQGD